MGQGIGLNLVEICTYTVRGNGEFFSVKQGAMALQGMVVHVPCGCGVGGSRF